MLNLIFHIGSFCHVAFVGMPFCVILQNFAKIGQLFDELWLKRFSTWRPSAILNFKNLILVTWLSSGSIYAVVYQISSKSDDFSLRYSDLTIFKMAAVRHLQFSQLAVFVMWPLSAWYSASSCKISLKSDNRLMSYGQNVFQHGGRPPS